MPAINYILNKNLSYSSLCCIHASINYKCLLSLATSSCSLQGGQPKLEENCKGARHKNVAGLHGQVCIRPQHGVVSSPQTPAAIASF